MNKLYPLIIAVFATTLAWAQGPPSSQKLEDVREQVTKYGSHLAYAQMRMLENKLGLDPKKSRRYFRLSRTSLLTDLYGGLSSNNSRSRGDLDLVTGKRAIEESLQTSSVSSRQTDDKAREFQLSEIESLKVRSHPWIKMLEEVGKGPERPGILGLVPADHFMFFAEGGGTIKKLEASLQELAEGAENLFEIQEKLKVREKIAKRLGINGLKDLEALISRSVFVSEDLDFYPNTHYALIVDAAPLIRATASMFLTETPFYDKVGDYLVLSTSKELLDRIRATHKGTIPNMRDSLDFRYANAVLDPRRDAVAYLSEDFILKLVSPKYRINAARRIAASEKLSALQYTVLSYRALEDEWPVSFHQIVKEGYISEADDETYSIDHKGVVSHRVWGSLYQLKALSEVSIDKVSKREKQAYDRFRKGYQSFWREFFDPVGMSIAVNDRLSVHTIILPLIDNGDYRWLQVLTGGKPTEFEALSSGLSHFPIRLHSRFQFDEALLNYLSRGRSRDNTLEERKLAINKQFQGWFRFEEPIDVFGMIGDEASLSFGKGYRLSHRFDDSQMVFSLKLKDEERFKNFIRTVLPRLGSSTRKREIRTHNGQEYVAYIYKDEVSLGAVYSEGFVHIALSDSMIQQVCEAVADQDGVASVDWPGAERTGREHNILFLMNMLSLDDLKDELIHFEDRNWVSRHLEDTAGYLWDASLISQAGVDQKFFREVPSELFNIPVTHDQNGIQLGGLALSDINFAYQYSGRRYRKGNTRPKVEMKEDPRTRIRVLLEKFHDPNRLSKLEAFKDLAVGMKFTPEGLSTRVSVNNPAHRR